MLSTTKKATFAIISTIYLAAILSTCQSEAPNDNNDENDNRWKTQTCPIHCDCSMQYSQSMNAPLKTVDCSKGGLRHVPAADSIPSDTQALILSHNRIRHLPYSAEADRLQLSQLLVLDLSHNRIASLPHNPKDGFTIFEGFFNLRHLNLAHNSIKRIGAAVFRGLPQLKSLDLQHNSIDGIIDTAFMGMEKLETLRLSDNKLSYVQKSWWRPINGLYNLHLDNNQISLIQSDAFKPLNNLIHLDLSTNQIFRINKHAFFGMGNLETLSLDRNGLQQIPRSALQSVHPTLKSLRFDRNPVYRLSMDDFANLSRVKHISLGHMNRLRLVERGVFKNLPSLIVLDLHDSPFLAFLDELAFVNVPSLTHLNLYNNNLTLIAPTTLDSLPALKQIAFYGNPLACDCNARLLKQKLADLKLSGKAIHFEEEERMFCDSPARHKFKVFTSLEASELPEFCAPRLINLFDGFNARKLGQDITYDCRAVGVPKPKIIWIAPDGSVINPHQYHPRRVLIDEKTLIIRHMQFQDEGQYTCVAESSGTGETALAQTVLNVTSIQVQIVPIRVTDTTATITWRGPDRPIHVFQVMYRELMDGQEDENENSHGYAGTVTPIMKTFTIHSLIPKARYEICIAYEDGQSVISHISCTEMRTNNRSPVFSRHHFQQSRHVIVLAASGILGLLFLLMLFMCIMLRRGASSHHSSNNAYAYDNLGGVEAGLVKHGADDVKQKLSHSKTPTPSTSPPSTTTTSPTSSTQNIYTPLVHNS